MRFAEVFLRLGCGLVAWMVVYAYALWLAVLHLAGCADGNDQLHRVLLGLAPLAAGCSLLLPVTRPFPDVHRMLRWLGVPLALLLAFALRNAWRAFALVDIDGRAICGAAGPQPWEYAWAPVQVLAVLSIGIMIYRSWHAAARTP